MCIRDRSSSGGTGVFVDAGSSTASNGVIALGATGMAGYATVSGSNGVYGNAGTSAGSHGVYGTGGAAGVYGAGGTAGLSGSGTTYGVYGYSASGYGVYGTSPSSGLDAVHGVTASGGAGVSGINDGGTGGWGVYGANESSNGVGGGFYNTTTGDALFLSLIHIYPSAKFPQVIVGQSDISGVRVTLGAKGGVLEGKVRDETTRLPIVGAKITISDARAPGAYVEVFSNKDGGFQFTVPAKPVLISATAMGYEKRRAEEVALSGGQHRRIEIDLRPR